MLSMQTRNEYLGALIRKNGGYHTQSKNKKSKLLDEYCAVTKQNRKYVIRKLRSGAWVHQLRAEKLPVRRIRKSKYDRAFVPFLITCWKIFDRACGQRLATLLHDEVERLRRDGELNCSSAMAEKLKRISPRSIDKKLINHKEKEKLKQKRSTAANPLLFEKIPVKLSDEWNRNEPGNVQTDLVEHCGQSAYGNFIYTLSNADIDTGWWEGGAQFGRGMVVTQQTMDQAKKRCPFQWIEIHSDNDSAFINQHLFAYANRENLKFSRSRPYHKNDNCFVEQKNNTHVRRCFGHLRYDTEAELKIINGLYEKQLRLYKNFFQPVMKLISKERINGHLKRHYDKPLTPYQRVLQSRTVPKEVKKKLTAVYVSLNPAQLRREIDVEFKELRKFYDGKQHCVPLSKFNPKPINNSVTFLNCPTSRISVT